MAGLLWLAYYGCTYHGRMVPGLTVTPTLTLTLTRPPWCVAASVVRGGKFAHLGQFSTAEEAAVVYARTPEARACVERLRVEAVEAMCDQLPATAAACWEQAA
eukprot:scaffold131666_cov60-Phaeocystis_antarctica.AAC.3